jgi:hypothetical protein
MYFNLQAAITVTVFTELLRAGCCLNKQWTEMADRRATETVAGRALFVCQLVCLPACLFASLFVC